VRGLALFANLPKAGRRTPQLNNGAVQSALLKEFAPRVMVFQLPAVGRAAEGGNPRGAWCPFGWYHASRISGFTCAAVAPFSLQMQPSRARTAVKRGKPCAKEAANLFDGL